MPGQVGQNGEVRVSPMDQRGRPISPLVLIAAEEVSRRAVRHAERLRIDPAVAANLLEEAAATVSRAIHRNNANGRPVRDLESYLFRAFLRLLNRVKKRQSLIAEALELEAFLSQLWDSRRALERKIFVDELLIKCDPVMRDVLCRRLGGYSWKEVARAYRISTHAAESKFSQVFQKVKKRLGVR